MCGTSDCKGGVECTRSNNKTQDTIYVLLLQRHQRNLHNGLHFARKIFLHMLLLTSQKIHSKHLVQLLESLVTLTSEVAELSQESIYAIESLGLHEMKQGPQLCHAVLKRRTCMFGYKMRVVVGVLLVPCVMCDIIDE